MDAIADFVLILVQPRTIDQSISTVQNSFLDDRLHLAWLATPGAET